MTTIFVILKMQFDYESREQVWHDEQIRDKEMQVLRMNEML